ncbi:MAG: hypothetical protein ACKOCH_20885, partial [Bacteroidota bacterium]
MLWRDIWNISQCKFTLHSKSVFYMKIRNLIFLLLFPLAASSQTAHVFQIIPKPVAILPKEGAFAITPKTKVFAPKNDTEWAVAAEYLTLSLAPATGYK